jgi:hypothetical protein
MNLLSWNARVTGDPKKALAMKDLIKMHKPTIVFFTRNDVIE